MHLNYTEKGGTHSNVTSNHNAVLKITHPVQYYSHPDAFSHWKCSSLGRCCAVFLLSKMYRAALGPTRRPVKFVREIFSEVKAAGGCSWHFHLVPRLMTKEAVSPGHMTSLGTQRQWYLNSSVSNPRPARLCHAAYRHISKLYTYGAKLTE
jgi:hypothetical protein